MQRGRFRGCVLRRAQGVYRGRRNPMVTNLAMVVGTLLFSLATARTHAASQALGTMISAVAADAVVAVKRVAVKTDSFSPAPPRERRNGGPLPRDGPRPSPRRTDRPAATRRKSPRRCPPNPRRDAVPLPLPTTTPAETMRRKKTSPTAAARWCAGAPPSKKKKAQTRMTGMTRRTTTRQTPPSPVSPWSGRG